MKQIISNTVIAGPWGCLDANKVGHVPVDLADELIANGTAKEVINDDVATEDSGTETDSSPGNRTRKLNKPKVTLPGRIK